jgi:hypothetical protein
MRFLESRPRRLIIRVRHGVALDPATEYLAVLFLVIIIVYIHRTRSFLDYELAVSSRDGI